MELKQCPFCGGKAELREERIELPMSEERNVFFVICTSCGCSPFPFGMVNLYYKKDCDFLKKELQEKAVLRWNERSE